MRVRSARGSAQPFDALPALAKDAVYQPYTRLSLADRRAIVEILRNTKKGLPDYFQLVRN